MKRRHLFEFNDAPWFPATLRQFQTDYLHYIARDTGQFDAVEPLLGELLDETGADGVVDLCSGGGGPVVLLAEALRRAGRTVEVTLSDLFPNLPAFARAEREYAVSTIAEPVDATDVPDALTAPRTLFNCLHHFPPEQARAVLRNAVEKRRGILVVEGTGRSLAFLASLTIVPIAILLVTPRIRPFRLQRLFWTYLVPAIPLATAFDAWVSCLRTYTPDELDGMMREIGAQDYTWRAGTFPLRALPVRGSYLIGYPSERT